MSWKSVFTLTMCILLNKNYCIRASSNETIVYLNKCIDFDLEGVFQKNSSMTIPGYLMADGNSTEFRFLSENQFDINCNKIKLVTLQAAPLIKPVNKTIGFKLRGNIFDHFTKEGFLMMNSTYYDLNNYCISNFSDPTSIEVRVCEDKCSAEGNKKGISCVNIPKCCGIGQEIVYWNFTCQNSKRNTWSPNFYNTPHEKVSTEVLANIRVQYSRPFLKCTNRELEQWPLETVRRPKNISRLPTQKLKWRLLKDGSIKYLSLERTWIPLAKGEFCMDGFANWGLSGDGHYNGLETQQVILLCPEILNEIQPPSWIAYLYAIMLFVSSTFLLLTIIVHFALLSKLPVHGLTVLSHSVSMFLMYIFLGTAYLTSAIALDGNDSVIKLGSFPCILIGICAHFFFFSTFFWLTIMNFDLWWTFRIVKPLGGISKRMKRFKIYSLVSWGIPIAIISSFVGLNFTYRDIESEVPVPDYGVNSCFVARHARGMFIYYIIAFLISVNVLLIVSTCITFIEFQRNNRGLSSKKTTKCAQYSFKLFARLFLVMGVAWCFELYSWTQNSNKNYVSWHVIVLDFIMFFQAVGNFIIFCCNERTVANLEEKFPQYKNVIKPIKTLFCLKAQTGSGNGYDLRANASGSTIRKLSTTISQSINTDQTA